MRGAAGQRGGGWERAGTEADTGADTEADTESAAKSCQAGGGTRSFMETDSEKSEGRRAEGGGRAAISARSRQRSTSCSGQSRSLSPPPTPTRSQEADPVGCGRPARCSPSCLLPQARTPHDTHSPSRLCVIRCSARARTAVRSALHCCVVQAPVSLTHSTRARRGAWRRRPRSGWRRPPALPGHRR